MEKIHWLKLIGCIVLCQAAGVIGLIFINQSLNTWYAGLNKPSFNPPSWVFGPVWTFLYLLMAISLYLIMQQAPAEAKRRGLVLFFMQLFLNILWPLLFFGLRNPSLGLIGIVLLLFLVVLTTMQFSRLNISAGILFYPYMAWVSFAAILNYFLYSLN